MPATQCYVSREGVYNKKYFKIFPWQNRHRKLKQFLKTCELACLVHSVKMSQQTIRRMRVACLVSKAKGVQTHARFCDPTRTHAHAGTHPRNRANPPPYQTHTHTNRNVQYFVNSRRYYVIRTLPLLLSFIIHLHLFHMTYIS